MPFDLDKAIAAWRRTMQHSAAFLPEDVEELERHVRDQVAALGQGGVDPAEAFARAMGEMGGYGVVEDEYRKVYWGKRRRRREVLEELRTRGAMLKNYLTIAWRTVLRQKGFAFINVFGLAVGIAFCVLILLYVRDEVTYDHFHTQGHRIFRVQETSIQPDGSFGQESPTGPIILGPALKADVPEIEHYVRFHEARHYVRASGDAVEEPVLYGDPAVLEVFTFPLRQGSPAAALADPGSVVITERIARKYFGAEDPVGRVLQIRLDQVFEDFTVTGVAADVPGNSTIRFDLLLSFERLLSSDETFRRWAESWHFYTPRTYVTLVPGASAAAVEARMPDFHRKYHADDIARRRGEGRYDENVVRTYHLKPLREIHLTMMSSPVYSYVLSGIALAVLLIACINFMTLAIGRSARRAKEVGIRKVVGARRGQLLAQFWGEALVLSGMALLVGLLLAAGFLPVFNDLTGKTLRFGLVADGTTAALLAGLVLFTGLVAGSYPALVLSGFRPIETLTNRLRLSGSNAFSKALVVLQFALSVFLIASTLVMTRQLEYTRSKELGFDREHVVVIPTSGLDGGVIAPRFRAVLEREPRIAGVTATGYELGRTGSMGFGFDYEGKQRTVNVFRVETNYLDFMGLDLVAGRGFDPNLATDSTRSIIVNETLVREFGLAEPLGKPIPGLPGDPAQQPVIVGVVEDHHYQALYEEVAPMMLTLNPGWASRYLLVRLRPGDLPGALALLETTWQAVAPDVPFTYRFLDDQMQGHYQDDRRWSQIVRYATLFAVLIACLGLLGLAALTVTRRTKEIGIRKVLGARVSHVVLLISREFALLVGVGVVLAAPVAYLAMQRWLEDFAYRIPLSGWLFVLAGLAALAVALLMVGYQAVRAAGADPVQSLRYE